MNMKTYKATIKLPNAGTAQVRIQAQNLHDARGLLEAQYGKERLFHGPVETR